MARQRMAAAEEAWSITGWRSLYQVAIENRWFETTDKTPWDAVFYSNFEDFVERFAIKNSIV